jgi:hypothetical protein
VAGRRTARIGPDARATLLRVGGTAYDELPCPPLPDGDGVVRDVWAEFSGYGPAGPDVYRISVDELVEDGLSHYWPHLVWDGEAWTPPSRDWLLQHFSAYVLRINGWPREPLGPDRS